MDPAVRKEKFAELTQMYKDVVKSAKSGDKAAARAKWAERKVKVAEFKALKKASA